MKNKVQMTEIRLLVPSQVHLWFKSNKLKDWIYQWAFFFALGDALRYLAPEETQNLRKMLKELSLKIELNASINDKVLDQQLN